MPAVTRTRMTRKTTTRTTAKTAEKTVRQRRHAVHERDCDGKDDDNIGKDDKDD